VHAEKHKLGQDDGFSSLVGSFAEEIAERLFAALSDHDLGDDAVLAEGAHGEDDRDQVVLDEQNGLPTHQTTLLAAHYAAIPSGVQGKQTPPAFSPEARLTTALFGLVFGES